MMHENSLLAHQELRESGSLSKRQAEIMGFVRRVKEATARDICTKLGYSDMNYVRPRITELIRMGKLEEVDNTQDKKTNKRVMIVRVKDPKRCPHCGGEL